jgi:hypothetical protein
LKNHYAILFGIREWQEEIEEENDEEGRDDEKKNRKRKGKKRMVTVRQILTARKGQRPTVWIDFTEARETMLSWDGYKMVLVRRDKTLSILGY